MKIFSIKNSNRFSLVLSVIALFLIIFDIGFKKSYGIAKIFFWFYHLTLAIGLISIGIRYLIKSYKPKITVRVTDFALGVLLLVILMVDFWSYSRETFVTHPFIYIAILLLFIRELSDLNLIFKKEYLNPAQLFIASFLVLILVGTGMLMLPRATYGGISFIDALFTATSAVCVTGLIVVDTATFFTGFGQSVIMVLIQIGGLGIMTFTAYFSYFFKGGSSYHNHLMLKDMINAEKLGDVFSMVKKIILLTFGIELVGAVIIFFTLKQNYFSSLGDQLYFSVFHSISSFCNAGFSTLSNGLFEEGFRFNYSLQIIIMILFIIGGIGFPVLLNTLNYLKYQILNKLVPFTNRKAIKYRPWIVNINTKIILVTTAVLLVGGTVLYYTFEYNNTLASHSEFGKWVTAAFGAATPRTAGFNTVDMSLLNFHTLMIMIFLMWIGASPGSTGGGIKTSTFAVATLNFFSLARGKERVEVYKREISQVSIRKAFSVIALSLIVTGIAIFLLVGLEPDKGILALTFEVFSAYSTVGLSTGITDDMSYFGKIVLIFTMFIGRVSMFTILVAFLKSVKSKSYQYPKESILIN
ncbi:MAG TPA: potassium transporter TrkG [Salinimicrobium sp.]|nr:potassium transporter TrkG [Salinimicrobium sp.]